MCACAHVGYSWQPGYSGCQEQSDMLKTNRMLYQMMQQVDCCSMRRADQVLRAALADTVYLSCRRQARWLLLLPRPLLLPLLWPLLLLLEPL